MKKIFKKAFTLIELIVVIVVLGILAAIVIPNISNWQKEATVTAVQSNVRNIQTSVDTYMLETNGAYPAEEKPVLGNPEPIDFSKVHPEELRNLPKTKEINYWVDHFGVVWASYVDSPKNVGFQGSLLTWEEVKEAASYRVYVEKDKQLTSSATQSPLKEVRRITAEDFKDKGGIPVDTSGVYYVSAVDSEGFESPPAGEQYEGYVKPTVDTPVSDAPEEPNTPSDPVSVDPPKDYNQNIIPLLTSHTNGQVTVSASSEWSNEVSTYYAWRAFDHSTDSSFNAWFPQNFTEGQWLKIDFGENNSKTVTKYTIRTRYDNYGYGVSGPSSWRMEASNTGLFTGEQVVLDTKLNQAKWVSNERREYPIINDQSYRYYRYVRLGTTSSADSGIGEMEMMEGSPN